MPRTLMWMPLLLTALAASAQAESPLPLHAGLQMFTHEQIASISDDAIGLRFRGPLTYPLAENLRDLLLQNPHIYNHVVLELDSEGGELGYLHRVIDVLADVRKRATFVTRVMGGGICASGCVAVFMQGAKRKASGASIWLFHGACSAGTNIPDPAATEEYINLLLQSGVRPEFIQRLRQQGCFSSPGNYFLSGYELYYMPDAGIITQLLPAWQPEDPIFPRVMPSR